MASARCSAIQLPRGSRKAEVYFFKCKNSTEADFLEKVLINKYKPLLNVIFKNVANIVSEIIEPDWINMKEAIGENTFNQIMLPKKKEYAEPIIQPEEEKPEMEINTEIIQPAIIMQPELIQEEANAIEDWSPDLTGLSPWKMIVHKHRALKTVHHPFFSLSVLKILDAYLGSIDLKKPEICKVCFHKADLSMLMDTDKIQIDDLQKQLLKLTELAEIDTKDGIKTVTLFSRCNLITQGDSSWKIEMECTDEAKQFIFDLEKRDYITYSLIDIARLTNIHSYYLFLELQFGIYFDGINPTVDKLKIMLHYTESASRAHTSSFGDIVKNALNETNKFGHLKYKYTWNTTEKDEMRIHFQTTGYRYYDITDETTKERIRQRILNIVTLKGKTVPMFTKTEIEPICKYILGHSFDVSVNKGLIYARNAFENFYELNYKYSKDHPPNPLASYLEMLKITYDIFCNGVCRDITEIV